MSLSVHTFALPVVPLAIMRNCMFVPMSSLRKRFRFRGTSTLPEAILKPPSKTPTWANLAAACQSFDSRMGFSLKADGAGCRVRMDEPELV